MKQTLKKVIVYCFGLFAFLSTMHVIMSTIFLPRWKILLSGDWILPVILWVLFAYFLLKYKFIVPERTDDDEDKETESKQDDSSI